MLTDVIATTVGIAALATLATLPAVPVAAALLHNTSTLLIGMDSMKSVL